MEEQQGIIPQEQAAEKVSCPHCSATEITYNSAKGMLVCDFCRTEFKPKAEVAAEVINNLEDIAQLMEVHLSEGMRKDAEINTDIQAFKCPNCKAEIGVSQETNVASLSCHWCRHQISIADKIMNGVKPDAVIEFKISKEQAKENIAAVLNKKKFFAAPEFVKSFNIEAIKPVYLPYVTVDVNSQNHYSGHGGVFKRKNTGDKNKGTTYDYDLYNMSRTFDFQLNNLTLEANSAYFVPFGHDPVKGSKNVLNNVQPFHSDAVKPYTPAYFNGDYRVEFKNVSLEELKAKATSMVHDIAIVNMKKQTCSRYSHGVEIVQKEMTERGANYCYILAPIWLYSYSDEKNRLNYIAVNGQTGKTSACVPINKSKLWLFSALVEVGAIIAGILLLF